jgi:hypothetical protein
MFKISDEEYNDTEVGENDNNESLDVIEIEDDNNFELPSSKEHLEKIVSEEWIQYDSLPKINEKSCSKSSDSGYLQPKRKSVVENQPLLHYLLQRYNCSLITLQVHFTNISMRRRIIDHLRTLEICTTHLEQPLTIVPHDFTIQNATHVQALGGYLGITVRQYYAARHKIKLIHPYLPCLIEHGGRLKKNAHRIHQSYYPLELLCVRL